MSEKELHAQTIERNKAIIRFIGKGESLVDLVSGEWKENIDRVSNRIQALLSTLDIVIWVTAFWSIMFLCFILLIKFGL